MTKRQRLFLDLGMLAIFAPLACFLFLSQDLPKTQPAAVVRNVLQDPVPAPPEAIPTRPHRINEESFQKIQLGMTVAEVEAIIGVPGGSRSLSNPGEEVEHRGDYTTNRSRDFLVEETERTFQGHGNQWWTCDTFGIMVGYDRDGKTACKAAIPMVAPLPNYPGEEPTPTGGITQVRPMYYPRLAPFPESIDTEVGPRSIHARVGWDSLGRALAFSPDGRYLASYHGRSAVTDHPCVAVWDTQTGLRRWAFELPISTSSGSVSAAFSPGGAEIAVGYVADLSNALVFCNLKTGERLADRTRQRGLSVSLWYSPDGKYLAALGGGIRLFSTTTREMKEIISEARGYIFQSAKFSTDGEWLHVLSVPFIKSYDLINGKWRPDVHVSTMSFDNNLVCVSPDGKTLITKADGDYCKINKWYTVSERFRSSGYPPFSEKNSKLDFDGRIAVWAAPKYSVLVATSAIYVYDLDAGKLVSQIDCDESNNFLISPDRKRIAVWGMHKGLRVHSISDGSLLHTLCEGMLPVFDVRFSGERKFVSLSEDGTLNKWDLQALKDAAYQKLLLPKFELLASWDGQGKLLATASRKGALRLWEADTGRLLWQKANVLGYLPFPDQGCDLKLPGPGLIFKQDGAELSWPGRSGWFKIDRIPRNPIKMATDGSTIAYIGKNGSIEILDTATGNEIKSISLPFRASCFAIGEKLLGCAADGENPEIKVFRVQTGEELKAFRLPGDFSNSKRKIIRYAASVQISPDEKWFAVVENFGIEQFGRGKILRGRFDPRLAIHLWEIDSDKEGVTLPEGESETLAFSPDGKLMAVPMPSLTDPNKSEIRIWDLARRELSANLEFENTKVFRLAFSTDSRILAGVASESQIFLWDLATGKQITGPEKAK
jgi:WD40 repeat protein